MAEMVAIRSDPYNRKLDGMDRRRVSENSALDDTQGKTP